MRDQDALLTKADLVTDFVDLRASILHWLTLTQIAIAGFILAAIEFTL